MLNLASYLEFFRPLLVTLVMGASSFVIGSVVGYQFHLTLLRVNLENDHDFERNYRRSKRRFYEGAFAVGLAIVWGVDSWTSSPLYYLIIGAEVFLGWVSWIVFVYIRMGDRIRTLGVRWKWWVSSLSLAFTLAFIGATFVSQWFQWMGWRQDVLKW